MLGILQKCTDKELEKNLADAKYFADNFSVITGGATLKDSKGAKRLTRFLERIGIDHEQIHIIVQEGRPKRRPLLRGPEHYAKKFGLPKESIIIRERRQGRTPAKGEYIFKVFNLELGKKLEPMAGKGFRYAIYMLLIVFGDLKPKSTL